MSTKAKEITKTLIIRIFFMLYAIIILVPFVYMFMNSFKDTTEYYAGIWTLPSAWDFRNYVKALEFTQLHRYAINTIFVVCIALALNLSLASMVSYVIARMKTKSGPLIYRYFLFGLLMPQVVAIIPTFFVSKYLFLYNTRLILIFTYAVFNLPFAVFTMSAFFKTLPHDLEEAALIDGASYFMTFERVMLPLAKPGLVTVGVFNFLEMWSDYMLALTLIADEGKKTVSLAIIRITRAQTVKTEWGAMFAACVMITIPVIILYALFQRQLTTGLTAGSIKG
jgi:N-acetylglucosamine transport system permease protein